MLLGFDFPLGLPAAYARRAGIDDFAKALPQLGSGRFAAFYDVADRPDEIRLTRPFYPEPARWTTAPAAARRARARALDRPAASLRPRTPTRNAACALFWTLGGSQVGKAAIAGWRDLLAPALRAGLDLGSGRSRALSRT